MDTNGSWGFPPAIHFFVKLTCLKSHISTSLQRDFMNFVCINKTRRDKSVLRDIMTCRMLYMQNQ